MSAEEEGRFVLDAERNLLRVAGRPFPVDPTEIEVSDFAPVGLFTTTFRTRRCRVVFENRWAMSVIWGSGT